MFVRLNSAVFASLIAVSGVLTASPAMAQTKLMTVGTGGISGVYYAVGGALCRVVNKDRSRNAIRCTTEVSSGSVANIHALTRGVSGFAIAQSDIQYQAVKGEGAFTDQGPNKNLRSVVSIYPEVFAIVVGHDVPGTYFRELAGKRVSLGVPGSGSRSSVDAIIKTLGAEVTSFAPVTERTLDEQSYALCEGKVDAYVAVIGHPTANIARSLKDCKARVLGMREDTIAKITAESPVVFRTEIPANSYPDQPQSIASVGLAATLLATDSTPEAMVYEVVKSVFERIDELKTLHPVLANLNPQRMIKDGLAAPLHPGAIRYYKEKGWL